MIDYLYDGTFEGLLTAIYESYYRQDKPDQLLSRDEYEQTLFSQPIIIETDAVKAAKVYRSIEDKISATTLQHVFYAFLSETKGIGTLIYHYLKLGWQVGANINRYHAHERVRELLNISQKVSQERHRMLGLIRFRQLAGDVYYAPIAPDNNIVGLVAPHFVRRLADQNWLIHDVKRGLAALYNQQEWIITAIEPDRELILTENETLYQELWREYFASTAITDRINPKLQRQYMPVRYWQHLIEK